GAETREGAGVEPRRRDTAIEEGGHPVRRREHEPAIGGEVGQVERERLDRDRGKLYDLGAQPFETQAQLARLLAGARHDDREAEERSRLEPCEVEAGDLPHDDRRRGADAGVTDRGERRAYG